MLSKFKSSSDSLDMFHSTHTDNIATMFSLAESDTHYLVAVNIPTIPTVDTEILASRDQVTVTGLSKEYHEKQNILKLYRQGKKIRTVYLDGILYVLLPKMQLSLMKQPTKPATA